MEIVTSQADGLLRAFSSTPRDKTCPTCSPGQPLTKDSHSGQIRWEFQIGGPVSDFATADLDGDGRLELLVGSGDRKLRALEEIDGACSVLWELSFDRTVGSPIVADLDDDGVAEILVPTADGRIHCLAACAGR